MGSRGGEYERGALILSRAIGFFLGIQKETRRRGGETPRSLHQLFPQPPECGQRGAH